MCQLMRNIIGTQMFASSIPKNLVCPTFPSIIGPTDINTTNILNPVAWHMFMQQQQQYQLNGFAYPPARRVLMLYSLAPWLVCVVSTTHSQRWWWWRWRQRHTLTWIRFSFHHGILFVHHKINNEYGVVAQVSVLYSKQNKKKRLSCGTSNGSCCLHETDFKEEAKRIGASVKGKVVQKKRKKEGKKKENSLNQTRHQSTFCYACIYVSPGPITWRITAYFWLWIEHIAVHHHHRCCCHRFTKNRNEPNETIRRVIQSVDVHRVNWMVVVTNRSKVKKKAWWGAHMCRQAAAAAKHRKKLVKKKQLEVRW